MTQMTRRRFLQVTAGAALLGTFGISPRVRGGARKARIVIVGGGFGGAVCARYLRQMDPALQITLIEMNPRFVSCPMSNEVLSGERDIATLTFGHEALLAQRVEVVLDKAIAIDPQARQVRVQGGRIHSYDKLVISPGIDFRWDAIEGYDAGVAETLPHAWKAGPQTLLLRRQLAAMRDGGVVAIAAPPNPYRCPPGPYERASQIAHYLKRHKPRSKVLILDAKPKFAKQALFQQAWDQHYGSMIEWVPSTQGGQVTGVQASSNTALTAAGEQVQADVLNLIPPQHAGAIAHDAGLVNELGWCDVDQRTFALKAHKDIHVIGDACIAGDMPKSAYAANSQGKACAAAIVAETNAQPVPDAVHINTCYSIVAPRHGISVAAVYRYRDGRLSGVKDAGGVSPLDAPERLRELEAQYAHSWFRNIIRDTFG